MEAAVKIPQDARVSEQSFWQQVPLISFVLGVACMVAWAATVRSSIAEAMPSYLFSYTAVLGIALGCMIFVLIQHITRAGWSAIIRRVPEAAMATMPLFLLLFLPIALFAKDIFPWMSEVHHDQLLEAKAPYLNVPFFMTRSFAYLIIWCLIGVWFYRTSQGQDAGEKHQDSRKMWVLAAPAIAVFALTVSFASFDWLMSLQPHWYSTIFGVYYFANCFLSGLAFIVLTCMGLQRSGLIREAITTEHYHDLGKLLFAFTVFWAYIAFSQFMLYWYPAVPEETEFYMHRLKHGWENISWWMPISHFFFPFFVLLSRHAKRNKAVLASMCVYILLMRFVDIYWLSMPNFGHLHVKWTDVVCLLGMLFLFFGCASFLLVRGSLAPVGDPRLKESLAFENF